MKPVRETRPAKVSSSTILRAICAIGLGAGLSAAALAQNGAAASSGTATSRDPQFEMRFDTLRPDNSFRGWRRPYQDQDSAETSSIYTAGMDGDKGRTQHEMTAGFYRPLSDSLSSLVEASYLPNAQGMIEWSVLGQVGAALGSGWGIQAGVRHSELGLQGLIGPKADAQMGLLALEKVWSNYRSQYVVYTSRKDNGGTTSGHRVALDYLYGNNSSFGLSIGRSWSADTPLALPIGNGGASSNVGVSGEHWLSRTWSMNYDALLSQETGQGLKPELRVGLRLAF